MEQMYIFFVAVLIILALSDLVVGVSNDAVNFLNSAIGSKAAPFWAIMVIASLGILMGATFSSGMMEVARKGIFHPTLFSLSEIMIVFLAVMLTDILLLDLFNTFGLPTSTTVSIVFELLGAAVAVAIIKVAKTDAADTVLKFINTESALTIIGGILSSIVIAFTIGLIVQYVTRIIFSFNYSKPLKYFGALWGGIAITAITYFILIKGAKGSSLITDDLHLLIKENTLLIIFLSLVAWTVVLQIIMMFTRFNILKFIVLIGTFALAMAFAGNDLVNFIGVPLAGLKSFTSFSASSITDPDQYTMEVLAEAVKTPTTYLLIAGLVMVVTLWFSRKAKSVTETEINLARQDEGYERFGSSMLSRSIVRLFVAFGSFMESLLPPKLKHIMGKRFEMVKNGKGQNNASFDLIRASVNLTMASIVISFATSLKIPLSTTYVTFMVAMGTSLADGAWGRESAVYRVTGVISVIGGWFFTALIAFTAALTFAFVINAGGLTAVIVLLIVAILLLIRAKAVHTKREKQKELIIELEKSQKTLEEENILSTCNARVVNTLESVSETYEKVILEVSHENRKNLKKLRKKTLELDISIKEQKDNIHVIIKKLREDSIETGHFYVQVVDYLGEITNTLKFITNPAYDHINNNHKGLTENQTKELLELSNEINSFIKALTKIIKDYNFRKIDEILKFQQEILKKISGYRKGQLKRIKKNEAGTTKSSLLYLDILNETKNIVLYSVSLIKAQRDFILLNVEEKVAV